MMPVREYVRSSGGDPEVMRRAQEEVRLSFPLFSIILRSCFLCGLFGCLCVVLVPVSVSVMVVLTTVSAISTQGFELRPLTLDDFLHGQTEAGAGLSAGVLSVDQSTIDEDELEGANLD